MTIKALIKGGKKVRLKNDTGFKKEGNEWTFFSNAFVAK